MSNFFKHVLFAAGCLLLLAAGWAASPQISSEKPVIKFSLPMFTPEGNRKWLARGTEARIISREQFEVKELSFSLFDGKGGDKVQTLILSPQATIFSEKSVITGADSIRIINDEYEASGRDWTYSEKDTGSAVKEKNIKIKNNVHVIYRAEIKGLLQ
ncbi:hypothetical protein [Oleiharenicola lentus]|uniref:hypothetical protein n=1 Tax=Oleiharenicola lentus TaxID=2508720 RepID=UPI003F6697FA